MLISYKFYYFRHYITEDDDVLQKDVKLNYGYLKIHFKCFKQYFLYFL